MRTLGLVGGMSWVSTLDYYRHINEGINRELGGLNFARIIIYSVNFSDFQEHTTACDWEGVSSLLENACRNLENAGAEAVLLGANTAHAVAEVVQQKISRPLIHIASATGNEINKQGIKKVGLLGTKFTMEMGFYKNKLKEHGIEVIVPQDDAIRDYLQRTLKYELGKGVIREETKQQYKAIVNDLISEGAEGIILGCTEIPLLIRQSDVAVPVFNTTQIHADAGVAFMLS